VAQRGSTNSPQYARCTHCGHEVLVSGQSQGYITNDPLTLDDVRKTTGLDRFKARVLKRFSPSSSAGTLIDIGSASGKFLHSHAHQFSRVAGLEVTPECLRFTRDVLKLDIKEDARELPQGITVATAWHSLEHIPAPALDAILQVVASKMSSDARLIVSVPNASSRQYRWFRSAYAYFDVPNHLHQFTQESLDKLLLRCGFEPLEQIPSWPYNSFGYIQGLLNVATGTHNYLYYRLKRKSRQPSWRLDLANLVLLPWCVPIGWMLGLTDQLMQREQGVITACYKLAPAKASGSPGCN
jgi:DNA-directed RNA polymerase subunit RPC12/RpoP